MHNYLISGFVLLALGLAACGGGQESTGGEAAPAVEVDAGMQRAVDVRQSVLTLIAHNNRPLSGMARGEAAFDAAVVAKNSVRLQQLAAMLPDAFVTDTRGSGAVTEALDVIWEDSAGFAAKHDALQSASAALVAANGSDEAVVLEAIRNLGKTCGSCHDDFRLDD